LKRRIKVGKKKVTEYYHRGVVAHLVGFDLPIVLDIEMIAPGEAEIIAARRLLERLMTRYARFFDVVQGDAIYWEGPLFKLCQKYNKHLLAVLKDNNPSLLTDAKALLTGKPDTVVQLDNRVVKYWDQEGFTSDSITTPFRVLRTEEFQTKRERIARNWVHTSLTSNWFWATSLPKLLVPTQQLAYAGHERWSIENTIFNTLAQHWAFDHCYHHEPTAILNFILILFIAHTLLACFHKRNIKDPLWRNATLIAIAVQILITVVIVKASDILWLCSPARVRAP